MEFKIIEYGRGSESHVYLDRYLIARHQEFIGRKKWENLNEDHGREFDAYDVGASFALLVEFGQVVAGARLLRSDVIRPAAFGGSPYRYMVHDAYCGMLPGMPSDICFERPPIDAAVWEVTRIYSAPGRFLGVDLFDRISGYLIGKGGEKTIFLGPPAFRRILGAAGYAPKEIGPKVGEGKGAYVAFECPVRKGQG